MEFCGKIKACDKNLRAILTGVSKNNLASIKFNIGPF